MNAAAAPPETQRRLFAGASPRVCIAFWLFGLLNNVQYTITLAAARDIVGPTIPKATILLANVVPSFLVKLLASCFLSAVPYGVRTPVLAGVAVAGMVGVASAEGLGVRFAAIAVTSMASGVGEVSFLGMTHAYGRFAVAFWSSGTGAASLVGALVYNVVTTGFGWGSRGCLLASAVFPAAMVYVYFWVLPTEALRARRGYRRVDDDEEEDIEDDAVTWQARNIRRTLAIFVPYMLPLAIVYFAEYTINQGVAPTLLFDVASTPFAHYRDMYPAYSLLYQCGVFVSRSSTPVFRIHALYVPSLLQTVLLALLILQALFAFVPNIWGVFVLIFVEGLLGGLAYVNTFEEIMETMRGKRREFSLGVVSVSDSAGICLAGLVSLWLEPALCAWQVKRGIDWCRLDS